MKELLLELIALKKIESDAKEKRNDLEAQIYLLVKDQLEEEDKTSTFYADEIKLSIKPNFVVKVDQSMASECPDLFKVKYEMTYSQYKKLTNTKVVNEIVTISTNKPTFTVEVK